MHSLGVVLVRAGLEADVLREKPDVATVIVSQIDALLFRYLQPPQRVWGVDFEHYMFDAWDIGGRWDGWGDEARSAIRKQRAKPSPRTLPQPIRRNAIWSEDLARLRFDRFRLYPLAVITPYGQWIGTVSTFFGFGDTKRELRARDAWIRKMRKTVTLWSETIAVAVDLSS